MDIISQKLLSVLSQYKNKPFILVEPGGNHGDYLIYKGFHKIAKSIGLKFRTVTYNDFKDLKQSEDQVVYIHGSGGYVPLWVGGPESLTNVVTTHKGIVVLGPSTFSEDEGYVSNLLSTCLSNVVSKKVHIFAREEKSYQILRKFAPGFVEIDKDHDTALNLSREDLNVTGIEGRYKLYAIRYDKEMNSKLYDYFNWLDPIDVCKTFDEWVRFHARANEIITNRTHSSVLGCILKVRTTLMPNSYHKNRSIWEFSLRDRGVNWKDELSGHSLNRIIENRGRLRGLFTSQKYRSFRSRLLTNFSI